VHGAGKKTLIRRLLNKAKLSVGKKKSCPDILAVLAPRAAHR